MATHLLRINDAMIKRSVAFYAHKLRLSKPELNYNDPELKAGLIYEIGSDDEYVYIYYKDKFARYTVEGNDLTLSIDDFAEQILQPMIIQLRDSFNTYDDAGQII